MHSKCRHASKLVSSLWNLESRATSRLLDMQKVPWLDSLRLNIGVQWKPSCRVVHIFESCPLHPRQLPRRGETWGCKGEEKIVAFIEKRERRLLVCLMSCAFVPFDVISRADTALMLRATVHLRHLRNWSVRSIFGQLFYIAYKI